jgi:hypothetical protein
MLAGALALGALAAPRPAAACSVCGCGDPLVVVSDGTPRGVPLRLALDFESLTARARSDDHPAFDESLLQLTVRPVLVVSPTPSLNLVLQLPLVAKDWRLGPEGHAVLRSRRFGVGDLDLGARWFFFDRADMNHQSRQNLALSAGSSLPTGGDDARVRGERVDEHAQLGTGAFGPYVGLLYAFHRDPWNVYLNATWRTHTANAYEYRYGDAVLGTARVELRPWERVAFGIGVDGRWAAHDVQSGERQQNTGGGLLALTPGATANVFGELWLVARVQVPVGTWLHGRQHFGPTVLLSVQYQVRGLGE